MGITKSNQQPNLRYVNSNVEMNKQTPLKSLGNRNLLRMINSGQEDAQQVKTLAITPGGMNFYPHGGRREAILKVLL